MDNIENYLYNVLDALPMKDIITPGENTKDLAEYLSRLLIEVATCFDGRDIAGYLKDRGYNLVLDYEITYKVGR